MAACRSVGTEARLDGKKLRRASASVPIVSSNVDTATGAKPAPVRFDTMYAERGRFQFLSLRGHDGLAVDDRRIPP